MRSIIISALMLISLLFSACLKEEIDVTNINSGIQPQFGIPIANASIRADRVIDQFDDNGIITTAENAALSLVYLDTVVSLNVDELLQLPSQSYSNEIDLTPLQYATLLSNGSVTVFDDRVWSFESPYGDRLDSIRFKDGLFTLNVLSANSFPVSGFVRIFSADNTEAFTFDFADGSTPVAISNAITFENILLKFLNNPDVINGLRVQYEVTFQFETGVTGGPVDFEIGLSDFSIASVGGYLSPRSVDVEGLDAKFAFFNGYDGQITIADPTFRFYCSNGFGIGLGVAIESLQGRNDAQETLIYNATGLPNFPIVAPAITPGIAVETILILNNANMQPSLTEFLSFKPPYVQAGFGLTINPNNDPNQFATNLKGFDVAFEAEIPLYGSISDFFLQDTADVKLGDLVEFANETAELEQVDIVLNIANGFPIDVSAQIVLVDQNFQPVDSLFIADMPIFVSAPINTSVPPFHPEYGRAIGTTGQRTILTLNAERAARLESVTHMIIRVQGATTNNGDQLVRFFADDRFDVDLAGKVILNIQ